MPLPMFLTMLVISVLLYSCGTRNPPNQQQRMLAQQVANEWLASWQPVYQSVFEANRHRVQHAQEGKAGLPEGYYQALDSLYQFFHQQTLQNKIPPYWENPNAYSPAQLKLLTVIFMTKTGQANALLDLNRKRIALQYQLDSSWLHHEYPFLKKNYSYYELDSLYGLQVTAQGRKFIWEAAQSFNARHAAVFYQLKDLENQLAKGAGFVNQYTYAVESKGMTLEELQDYSRGLLIDLFPLYRELHTSLRYEVAQRLKADQVPDYLPPYWVEDLSGLYWNDRVTDIGRRIARAMEQHQKDSVLRTLQGLLNGMPGFTPNHQYLFSDLSSFRTAGSFFRQVGSPNLSEPAIAMATIKANDRGLQDILESKARETGANIALNPDTPLIFRAEKNNLALLTFLQLVKLSGKAAFLNVHQQGQAIDTLQLLHESIQFLPAVLLETGVVNRFAADLYGFEFNQQQLDARWWELKRQYLGIEQAQANYLGSRLNSSMALAMGIDHGQRLNPMNGLAIALAFTLHQQFTIQNGLPIHHFGYWQNPETTTFLHNMLYRGQAMGTQEFINNFFQGAVSSKAMLSYFTPLFLYLSEQNERRTPTLLSY